MAQPSSSLPSDGTWQVAKWISHRWQKRLPVILLADDNVADHHLVRRTLGEIARVDIVTDGMRLLEYFQPASATDGTNSVLAPDLVLLDINMPRMTGKEVLPKIRGTARGAVVPIVVFSSSETANDIQDCYKAGCNSYVAKPFELRHYQRALLSVAAYWLGLSISP